MFKSLLFTEAQLPLSLKQTQYGTEQSFAQQLQCNSCLVSSTENKQKDQVQLCWPGCQPSPIHRCYPTTALRGEFCLLCFHPGPVLPSLANLGTLASAGATISTQGLAWTPDLHRAATSSAPGLKPSSNPSLPVAGL